MEVGLDLGGQLADGGEVDAEQLRALLQRSREPLVLVGSGQLAQSLQDADLVDEYRLWLHPVVSGGKRLFLTYQAQES